MPPRTRAAPSYPKASMTQTHKWIPWPILLAFYCSMVYTVDSLISLSIFHNQVCPHAFFPPLIVQFHRPAAKVRGRHWKMISVLIGCIQWNEKLLYCRSYAGTVYTWWLEKTGPLLSHHQLTHKNMTLSRVITPCQVFIRWAWRELLVLSDSFKFCGELALDPDVIAELMA